jgi:hypothetical protein
VYDKFVCHRDGSARGYSPRSRSSAMRLWTPIAANTTENTSQSFRSLSPLRCEPTAVPDSVTDRTRDFRCWQILLQKYFWGRELKFSEPLMRLAPRDVRDRIVSRQNDHRPSYQRHGASQRQRCLEIDFREIFGVVGFSTFATKSANFGSRRQPRRPQSV